jgi:prepilin-type processing-associated H-X9-DG protein
MPYLAQRPLTGNDYRSVKIYRCPAYRNKNQTVCYVINGWNFTSLADTEGTQMTRASKLTDCNRRSFTIYIADHEDEPWNPIITDGDDPQTDLCDIWSNTHLPMDPTARRVAQKRHSKGMNILYLDWRVDYMDAAKMTRDNWRFKQ